MEIALPDLIISEDLIERIQFSVSSRNAEAKLSSCAVHIFAAPYSDNPQDIKWQYVSSGVACLLRNRELVKNGRRYMWTISLCLYNASYGVLVWKAKLLPNSDYTAVTENFHVFALGEVDVLVGLMFSENDQACELNATYSMWDLERSKDDGKRGYICGTMVQTAGGRMEPMKFEKKMISKPCNFQHIQGTQAIDECMDIEKIKSDIVASLFGMGTKAGRSETVSSSNAEKPKSKKKKKEAVRAKLEFKEIELPQAQTSVSPVLSSSDEIPIQDFALPGIDNLVQGGMGPAEVPPSNGCLQERSYRDLNSQEYNPTAQSLNPPGESYATDSSGYPGGLVAGGYDPNQGQRHVAELSQGSSSRGSNERGNQPNSPNFQNPASPSYQEYTTSNQEKYSYDTDPPRMDMSLEKELAESPIFKPSLMTAN